MHCSLLCELLTVRFSASVPRRRPATAPNATGEKPAASATVTAAAACSASSTPSPSYTELKRSEALLTQQVSELTSQLSAALQQTNSLTADNAALSSQLTETRAALAAAASQHEQLVASSAAAHQSALSAQRLYEWKLQAMGVDAVSLSQHAAAAGVDTDAGCMREDITARIAAVKAAAESRLAVRGSSTQVGGGGGGTPCNTPRSSVGAGRRSAARGGSVVIAGMREVMEGIEEGPLVQLDSGAAAAAAAASVTASPSAGCAGAERLLDSSMSVDRSFTESEIFASAF